MSDIVRQTNSDPIEERIRRLVLQKPGQRLPSERGLAEDLGISRPRLRLALDSLQVEGLIERRPGSGTFAVSQERIVLSRVTILIDDRLKLGDDPFVSHLFEVNSG